MTRSLRDREADDFYFTFKEGLSDVNSGFKPD